MSLETQYAKRIIRNALTFIEKYPLADTGELK
jgi:hypothetical protein